MLNLCLRRTVPRNGEESLLKKMKRGQDKRRKPEWIMKSLPRQTETCVTESHGENNIPDQIISLINQETQELEVCCVFKSNFFTIYSKYSICQLMTKDVH